MEALEEVRERVIGRLDGLAASIGHEAALERQAEGVTFQELIEIIALLGLLLETKACDNRSCPYHNHL